ncbi:MAG: DNA polymerase III subunit [bacterium]|nr:DNA polymerase III subunit [bacterium]
MIIGHERKVRYLERVLKNGRAAHAYLFTGPDSIGKRTIARHFARALLCTTSPVEFGGCGACVACRAVEAETHPSVLVLDVAHALVPPRKEESRTKISLDDIHEVRRRFSFAPRAGEWRIALIDEAEMMSGEAANGILKLLEEPGERVVFLLITAHPELVLPTIASRAEVVRFLPVADRVIRACLVEKGISNADQETMTLLSDGCPGRALAFIQDRQKLADAVARRERVRAVLSGHDGVEALALSLGVAGDGTEEWAILDEVWRELHVRLKTTGNNTEYKSLVRKIKKVDILATTLATTNANPRLVLDVILLEAVGR